MPKWLTPEHANVRLVENQDEYETIEVRHQAIPLYFDPETYKTEGPFVPGSVALLQFTPEELRRLIDNSGQITLCILGRGFPPCSVHVGDPMAKYAAIEND